MVKRARVGLLYSYNENWIGGTYYILNLISALNTVNDEKKPIVVLLTETKQNVDKVKLETNYPYLDYINYPIKHGLIKRGINKVLSYIGLTPFPRNISNPEIDLLYPNYTRGIVNEKLSKIYWIPDLQEAFLPDLFTEEQIQRRKDRQRNIAETGDFLVFSSKDSQNHYNKLYPNSKPEQFVMSFAVTHPNLDNDEKKLILSKYQLEKEYYFIPNQFWAHKNHITVLKALKEIKKVQRNIQFVFSGKEHDHRSTNYVEKLKTYIHNQKLEDNVKFLGFIPRDEQLIILKNSVAVIQPSLFEGWSTVVEDAKAQNKFIFLSDLPVHLEQIQENCVFFERLNHEDLANKLLQTNIDVKEKDYRENIKKFGNDFLEIIEKNVYLNN